MTKTYAVHYGNGHLARCKTLADDFVSIRDAKEAAAALVDQYDIVVIADTDGNEWPIKG